MTAGGLPGHLRGLSRGWTIQGAWLARGLARGIIRAMTGLECIAALKALGELSRLRIVRLLLKERLGVNAIAQRLAISQYNSSKHLRILKEA